MIVICDGFLKTLCTLCGSKDVQLGFFLFGVEGLFIVPVTYFLLSASVGSVPGSVIVIVALEEELMSYFL